MMALILPLGPMMNTDLTVCVLDCPGWSMPYLLAMSMVMSSIRGNVTSTFPMPFHSSSCILLSHAMCAYRESMESPTSSVFILLNSSTMDAKVMNSVVHTGVKSAGWENRITHFPL